MQLDLDEIQGNITPGFRKDHQAFLFYRFPDWKTGRRWLRALLPSISTAREVALNNQLYRSLKSRYPDERTKHRFLNTTFVNVGISAAGLRTIRMRDVDKKFDCVFTITPGDRLKDLGEEPTRQVVELGGDYQHEPHVIVIIGADSRRELTQELRRQDTLAAEHSLQPLLRQPYIGESLRDATEHFGFGDGISQPDPDDPLKGWSWEGSEQMAPPGEFILGLPRYGDGGGITESFDHAPAEAKYGSFLVFRKLVQDVNAFHDALEDIVRQLNANSVHYADATGRERSFTAEMVAARLMGRWPSGAKLTYPGGYHRRTDPSGDFLKREMPGWFSTITAQDYTSDALGQGCPLFAHIRKAFPRGNPGAQRHRIIRRGITFGKRWTKRTAKANIERGIYFLAYQARIKDGFRHIQREWLNNTAIAEPAPVSGGLAAQDPGADPMVGVSSELGRRFFEGPRTGGYSSIPIQPFVHPRALVYFFVPAISELRRISDDARVIR